MSQFLKSASMSPKKKLSANDFSRCRQLLLFLVNAELLKNLLISHTQLNPLYPLLHISPCMP